MARGHVNAARRLMKRRQDGGGNVEDGPFCGAKRRRREERCKLPAGFRTDHPGLGRCHLHGGCSVVRHGWYSKITHTRIANLLDELAVIEMNAMDLIPEANLLRAMTIDFVNRFDIWEEALMAWFNDPENKARPRRMMDIMDASHLIESISRIVHRMHQIQSEGSISLDTFRRVTEHMGIIVARHVPDTDTLKKIEAEWLELAIDAKSSTPGALSTKGNESHGQEEE